MKATNRWGETFAPGDRVRWTSGGIPWEAIYVKRTKPSDFSRAYGRQALVWCGDQEEPLSSIRAKVKAIESAGGRVDDVDRDFYTVGLGDLHRAG